jgi:precorrin-2/cobalt-factor-2 C20-methyltransferase
MGTCYGVGVGPGDPELITRKAERVLRSVDWIFLPAGGPGGSSFVRRIIEPLGLAVEKFRLVALCMSRDRAADRSAYHRAAEEIVEELRQGKTVAWVTEGDPLFFSTFVHIWEELSQHSEVRVEIIPGVNSTRAAAARACVPIAQLDDKVAIIPAAYGLERLAALLSDFNTVLLLKVHACFDQLLQALESSSQNFHAVYVENVGTPQERVVTDLQSLRGKELPYFSLVILRKETAR